jgi:cytidylate kinase
VFPSAQAKIYLTANQEDRAARRAAELGLSAEDMLKAQSERDQQDASRKAAPMQVPQDAMVVDTSNLNLDQVVAKVESYIRNLGFV